MKISDQKIIIIPGKHPINNNQDGSAINISKDKDEDAPHYYYMTNYIKENLQNDTDFQKMLHLETANSIFYEIQQLGNIVIAENTSYPNKKSAIIYIPKQLTEKQTNCLKNLQKDFSLENYNLFVFFNLNRAEDDIIDGKQMQGNSQVLNYFIDNDKKINNNKDDREI